MLKLLWLGGIFLTALHWLKQLQDRISEAGYEKLEGGLVNAPNGALARRLH